MDTNHGGCCRRRQHKSTDKHFSLGFRQCFFLSFSLTEQAAGVYHRESRKGRYQLTYKEAKAVCKYEGGKLATYKQLEAARQIGLRQLAHNLISNTHAEFLAKKIYSRKSAWIITHHNSLETEFTFLISLKQIKWCNSSDTSVNPRMLLTCRKRGSYVHRGKVIWKQLNETLLSTSALLLRDCVPNFKNSPMSIAKAC